MLPDPPSTNTERARAVSGHQTTQCNYTLRTRQLCKLSKEESGVGHDDKHGGLEERVVPKLGELHEQSRQQSHGTAEDKRAKEDARKGANGFEDRDKVEAFGVRAPILINGAMGGEEEGEGGREGVSERESE